VPFCVSQVSMYRSCKRLQHVLGEFKGHLHGVNETRPAAHLLPPADARFLKAGKFLMLNNTHACPGEALSVCSMAF
jgi:hypothetical protein